MNNISEIISEKNDLRVVSEFSPAKDQPVAIEELVGGLQGRKEPSLLGNHTGKTFTMAKIIEATQRPDLLLPKQNISRSAIWRISKFFPNNAVEYFVSYYDYYQPEAYVPRSDTYIEKEAQINEQIDRMRHSATRSLPERKDVVIVASVSCIYGIGSVETYSSMTQSFNKGGTFNRQQVVKNLVEQQYRRNDKNFQRGCFRARGDTVDVWPPP